MNKYQADVRHGGEVILEDITVYIEETKEESGLKSWYGVFQLDKSEHIEPGGPYRIQLDDNRSGDIVVANITVSSHSPIQVSFQGSGPLT